MQIIAAKTRLMDVPAQWQWRALFPDDEASLRQESDGRISVLVHRRPRPFAMLRAPRLVRLGDLAPGLAQEVAPLIARRRPYRVRVVDVLPPHQRPDNAEPDIWVSVWARRDPQPVSPTRAAAHTPEVTPQPATSPAPAPAPGEGQRQPRAPYPFGLGRKAGLLRPPPGVKPR